MFHIDLSGTMGLVLVSILWGILHGITPHGHSWLVLLPFALGGIKERGMLRMALSYSLGMLLTAAATGALLGLLSYYIPEHWHHGVELAMGGGLSITGLLFIIKPLSVHHAIDHMCGEHCHSGEEKALLHTGTLGAMFMLGAMSMLVPCPTNIPFYTAVTASAHSPLAGAAIFSIYALVTGIVLTFIAIAMVRARKLVETLEQRGYRKVIWRLSGLIVLGMGIWMLVLGMSEHSHGEHQEHHGAKTSQSTSYHTVAAPSLDASSRDQLCVVPVPSTTWLLTQAE